MSGGGLAGYLLCSYLCSGVATCCIQYWLVSHIPVSESVFSCRQVLFSVLVWFTVSPVSVSVVWPLAVSLFVGVRCPSGQDLCSMDTSKLGVSF